MLDYSLRDGGWLDEYFLKDGTEILIAEDNQEMVGFSILSQVPGDLAEFRIALHPYKLGRGIGKTLAFLTIRHGFRDPALHAIYLIVRKNNPRAQRWTNHSDSGCRANARKSSRENRWHSTGW